MKQCTITKGLLASTILATGVTAYSALADDFPNRSIEMIVAYSEGGATDVTARALAQALEKELGQSVVVRNMAGAAGEIGFTQLAQAEPDGYTIGFINTPPVVSIPIERDPDFALGDFDLIMNLLDDPTAITVRTESEIESFEQLVEMAKEDPGALTMGGSGIGSHQHFLVEQLNRDYDVPVTYIPFNGSGPSVAATMGGHITASADTIGNVARFVFSGDLRVLAQAANERSEHASDAPTLKELGYDITLGSMRGVAAPKGVPEEHLALLRDAVEKVANDPGFIAAAEERGEVLGYMDHEEFREALDELRSEILQVWETSPWN
ncbi:tripartite tricarboxylate transporter substrate binding protein [Halomonas alkalisoli]|uniref:tripartite tricarboxylate transporter substrate binding protein n=1 Tax=Halomonas alkalisoli TaxID=2907158 RepID=UPI001F199E6A|nr:tripartite tricarboxylate transporter substrate binding protein [Halomonas alkalisoli]MCE9681683.1 tripartite tricarboxylate transporter substrate binding protein [Halomonas alkalisoli]